MQSLIDQIHNPKDLYIPQQACQLNLSLFTGPLDLLLYLIHKNRINILDIPIAQVSQQYADYVAAMQTLHIELASEYLVMTAILTEIKSRLLLPKPPPSVDEPETDPRAELVQRLETYRWVKKMTLLLEELPQQQRDVFAANSLLLDHTLRLEFPRINSEQIEQAWLQLCLRKQIKNPHKIQAEVLPVEEKIKMILMRLQHGNQLSLNALLNPEEGRLGIVVTFIALLELYRQRRIRLIQSKPFGCVLCVEHRCMI
jgi:segregation and condensation protein A